MGDIKCRMVLQDSQRITRFQYEAGAQQFFMQLLSIFKSRGQNSTIKWSLEQEEVLLSQQVSRSQNGGIILLHRYQR